MLNQLDALVRKNSLYKNVGFTIHNLAEYSGIPSYRISYVINKVTGKNFSNWINAFRIEKFVSMIGSGDASRYTLDSIAPSCGFSSRSTLITAFKREKGITPGQFLKQKSLHP